MDKRYSSKNIYDYIEKGSGKMTYKLNPELSLIKAPVILVIDGKEKKYENGEKLISLTFEKNYLVESITVKDECAVIMLKENDRVNTTSWIGEEAVSFL